jgi:hypothetical protein
MTVVVHGAARKASRQATQAASTTPPASGTQQPAHPQLSCRRSYRESAQASTIRQKTPPPEAWQDLWPYRNGGGPLLMFHLTLHKRTKLSM